MFDWRLPMIQGMSAQPFGTLAPTTMPGMTQQRAAPQAPPQQQPASPPPAPPFLAPFGFAPPPQGAQYGAGVVPGQTPDVPMPGIPDYIWQLAMNPPGA